MSRTVTRVSLALLAACAFFASNGRAEPQPAGAQKGVPTPSPVVLAGKPLPPDQPIAPLVEIARWKSDGHAQPGFLVLARLAEYSDEDALDLWARGERERVIQAAVARARSLAAGAAW